VLSDACELDKWAFLDSPKVLWGSVAVLTAVAAWILSLSPSTSGATEINWKEFRDELLAKGVVLRLEVINNAIVLVYAFLQALCFVSCLLTCRRYLDAAQLSPDSPEAVRSKGALLGNNVLLRLQLALLPAKLRTSSTLVALIASSCEWRRPRTPLDARMCPSPTYKAATSL
jgi:hypothetical protein